MRAIRLIFIFLLTVGVAGVASAQTDALELNAEIQALDGALAHLRADQSALERAMSQTGAVVWPTANGWAMASEQELVQKATYLQLAEARAERKQQADRLAGLGLPEGLAQMVYDMPNRPARRVVREWIETQGAANEKALANYRQGLSRNIKLTEGWLADHRAQQAAAAPAPTVNPAAPIDSAYATGACYVPPGKWQVGSSREVLVVEELAGRLRATKTKGSPNIPAGEISFWLDPRTCDGALQWADEGYANPRWIRGRIEVRWITRDSEFSIEWPEREAVVYTKVG